MANINYCVLGGYMARTPDLRYTPQGTPVADFAIAVNRQWKDKDGTKKSEADFFDCVAWQRTAEIAGEHLKKGQPVLLEGHLQQERWEDKEGGRRSKIKMIVERIHFLGAKETEGEEPEDDKPV